MNKVHKKSFKISKVGSFEKILSDYFHLLSQRTGIEIEVNYFAPQRGHLSE